MKPHNIYIAKRQTAILIRLVEKEMKSELIGTERYKKLSRLYLNLLRLKAKQTQ